MATGEWCHVELWGLKRFVIMVRVSFISVSYIIERDMATRSTEKWLCSESEGTVAYYCRRCERAVKQYIIDIHPKTDTDRRQRNGVLRIAQSGGRYRFTDMQ